LAGIVLLLVDIAVPKRLLKIWGGF
jgi:hypothetical protein